MEQNYNENTVLFWPDKATSHHAKETHQFLHNNSVQYVPKNINPTNFPQGRPIEDVWV